ncbi:hypothetical protein BD770DRAFT_405385 [Pilaira anomala]|nr:hypothetical protein BD770DRAFT_405385 [Pilaira anomala]
MLGKSFEFIVDLNSSSSDFKEKFKLYVDQVKKLSEDFMLQFYQEISLSRLMGTLAAELCPELKKRIETVKSGEKRNSNEWNAFRHVYKDVHKNDVLKAKEAYEEFKMTPDRDIHMKALWINTTSLPRKQVVSSNSEAQLAPSSSRQQLCNNTKKVLELKKEIRIILRDKLKEVTNIHKLDSFPWDQMTTGEGFRNFKLSGWKYGEKRIDSMKLEILEGILDDIKKGSLCIVAKNQIAK